MKNKDFERVQNKLINFYTENLMLDQYRTLSVSLLDALLNATLYILNGLMIVKKEFTIGGAFAFITYTGYVVNLISILINIKYYFAHIGPSAKRFFDFWEQPEKEVHILDGVNSPEEDEMSLDRVKSTFSPLIPSNNTPVLELKDVWF